MTIKEWIDAEKAKLKAEYDAELAKLDAHEAGFSGWLSEEITVVKEKVTAFFAKL